MAEYIELQQPLTCPTWREWTQLWTSLVNRDGSEASQSLLPECFRRYKACHFAAGEHSGVAYRIIGFELVEGQRGSLTKFIWCIAFRGPADRVAGEPIVGIGQYATLEVQPLIYRGIDHLLVHCRFSWDALQEQFPDTLDWKSWLERAPLS